MTSSQEVALEELDAAKTCKNIKKIQYCGSY